jgi:hypothetical protein
VRYNAWNYSTDAQVGHRQTAAVPIGGIRHMSPRSLTNPLVDQYRRYRTVGKKLNQKIIDALMSDAVLDTAARHLNMGKDKRLIFDNESEPNVLMDYALYEIPQDGQNLIERYVIETGGSNRVERDLPKAMLNARTGLFRVEQVLASKYLVHLRDLADGNRSLSMLDISFSQFPAENCVFFFRPIELADFTMSTGCPLSFRRKWNRN